MRRVRPLAYAVAVALGVAPAAAARAGDAGAEAAAVAPHWPARAGTAAALLAGVAVLAASRPALAPRSCRWCEPDGFDRRLRRELSWRNPRAASSASDALQLAVPVLSFGAVGLEAWGAGGAPGLLDDLSLLAAAEGASLLATEAVKEGAGRLRPDAWARARASGGALSAPRGAALASFWSGHTASAFAAATSAGTLAWARGYGTWPWILGSGLAGAAACGWLRIAADRHWATDVLAGAAAGSLLGAGTVLLGEERRASAGASPPAVSLAFVPFGIAGRF